MIVQHVGQNIIDLEYGLGIDMDAEETFGALSVYILTLFVGIFFSGDIDEVAGVVTKPGDHFNLIGQLDQIVAGPPGDTVGLDLGILLGRENDDGDGGGETAGPHLTQQGPAIQFRHHQIQQDHHRTHFFHHGQGLLGILAVVQLQVIHPLQHATQNLVGKRFIINQQDA